jgi:lipoprotein-releasing system permease protein
MFRPLPLYIGLRYLKAKQRNQFISFVSLISLLGMILGVFALVVVMSVMNGFEKELRDRILSAVPHGYIQATQGQLMDWRRRLETVLSHEAVVGAAPYIQGNVILSQFGQVRPAQLVAVEPKYEQSVSSIASHMRYGKFDSLRPGEYGIVLGHILARNLGLRLGDSVNVLLPQISVTPVGLFPRQKRFKVVGVFSVGAQLDGQNVFIHLHDGQKLFQMKEAVQGLRLQFDDLFLAERHLQELASADDEVETRSWQNSQGSLFQAVQMEKALVACLLLMIMAIAAFNIISILVMLVADKRAAIAVLRTMGASPGMIMRLFMVQGFAVGLLGIVVGIVLGLPVALHIGDITVWLEQLMGVQVFNPQIYFITRIPSVVQWQDLAWIVGCSLLLSLLATIYPAWRASRIQPAEALRYE